MYSSLLWQNTMAGAHCDQLQILCISNEVVFPMRLFEIASCSLVTSLTAYPNLCHILPTKHWNAPAFLSMGFSGSGSILTGTSSPLRSASLTLFGEEPQLYSSHYFKGKVCNWVGGRELSSSYPVGVCIPVATYSSSSLIICNCCSKFRNDSDFFYSPFTDNKYASMGAFKISYWSKLFTDFFRLYKMYITIIIHIRTLTILQWY